MPCGAQTHRPRLVIDLTTLATFDIARSYREFELALFVRKLPGNLSKEFYSNVTGQVIQQSNKKRLYYKENKTTEGREKVFRPSYEGR